MTDPAFWHRLQFAFTITYHYLFPQLTMGLALLIVVLKSLALWKRDESYGQAARFWARIFAINFAMGIMGGVVHSLRLNLIEFFNWSLPEEGQRFAALTKKAEQ